MMTRKTGSEKTVRGIRRATRKHHSAEEKIRIILDGLRGEESIAERCRLEGIKSNFVLSLLRGISGSRQETSGWRHCTGSHQGTVKLSTYQAD